MTLALQPYPEYKDSGLPWLAAIPAHWQEKRAKYLFREVDERSSSGDEELLSVSHLTGVTPRSQKNVTMFMAESYAGHKLCRPGDLVINTMWAWMAALGVARHAGLVSPGYAVYRPIQPCALLPEFVDRLLRTKPYQDEYTTRSTGVRSSRLRLYPEKFLEIPVLCPPPEEQSKMLTFLAHFDRRINRLIRAKRRLIELLNEQKQAIIHRAVTCGLDPNVRFKPSGIDWLGDVPEHWEVRRLKHVIAQPLKYGANEAAEESDRSAPRYIRITDIDRDGHLIEETFRSLAGGRAAPYLLRDGDILLARSGATVGKSFLYSKADGPAAYAGYLIRARVSPGSVLPRYLYTFVQSPAYWRWISTVTIQATIQNVSAEKYASLSIPLPPPLEQPPILEAIADESRPIDLATARARGEIQLLREYCTRLIADVVTGKLDVRGVELPALEEEALDELALDEEGEAEEVEQEDDGAPGEAGERE